MAEGEKVSRQGVRSRRASRERAGPPAWLRRDTAPGRRLGFDATVRADVEERQQLAATRKIHFRSEIARRATSEKRRIFRLVICSRGQRRTPACRSYLFLRRITDWRKYQPRRNLPWTDVSERSAMLLKKLPKLGRCVAGHLLDSVKRI